MSTCPVTKEEINNLYKIIQKLYLEDSIPWVIGYSGGKDSTAVLQLVWYALSELPKESLQKNVHVISTDTLVESPVVAEWVIKSHNKMELAAKKQQLPFIAHRLTPLVKDSFWVNLIGRGYPYPRATMRWCTDRLKIKPANTFVQNVVAAHGEVILVLGTRKAESINRSRTMEYYEGFRVRDYLSPNSTMQNELVFSPIEDWKDDDVWMFLMQYKNPWGHSNKDLLTMYRGATADGECPLVINTDTPSCGKSRFGCWVCTLVEQDKSMAAMITNDEEKAWMTPLLEFRNEIGADNETDRERRDFRRMHGTLLPFKDRLVHGPYKKQVRENWLYKLLSIQQQINRTGPQEVRKLRLITNDELSEIRRIWLNEKHEFDDALPRIYEKVTGKRFADKQYLNHGSYGSDEWALLSNISNKEFPEEELLFELGANLLDIEYKTSDIKNRKGVLSKLEQQIRKCYYKNEEDATAFALDKNRRKRAMGGKYNEKAEITFSYVDEPAEDEDGGCEE